MTSEIGVQEYYSQQILERSTPQTSGIYQKDIATITEAINRGIHLECMYMGGHSPGTIRTIRPLSWKSSDKFGDRCYFEVDAPQLPEHIATYRVDKIWPGTTRLIANPDDSAIELSTTVTSTSNTATTTTIVTTAALGSESVSNPLNNAVLEKVPLSNPELNKRKREKIRGEEETDLDDYEIDDSQESSQNLN